MKRSFTNRNNPEARGRTARQRFAGFAACISVCYATLANSEPQSAFSPALIEAIQAAEVVVIGELHPNKEHHENQARLVEIIAPKALVFEMIEIGQGPAFAQGFAESDRDGFLTRIEESAFGWPSLDEYLGILEAKPGAMIYGAASPRSDVRNTVTQGAAAVFGEGAERFGLTQDLPQDQQQERENLQKVAHCNALPDDLLGGMVEAQRFRDAVFARRVLDALEQTGGPVVLITGNGHAREDWGVPAVLAIAAPDLNVLSIGQGEEPGADDPFDQTIKTAPFDEGDPCSAFKKSE